jgi:hypothetical protein
VDSRRIIIVLSVCLALALIAVGFLAGRESARQTPVVMSAPVIAPSRPTIDAPVVPEPAIAPNAVAGAAPLVATPAPPARRPVGPQRIASGDTGEKAAVERYFGATDPLQNADVENPEASGNALMEAASSGDLSGLHALVAKARLTEAKARALTPPPSCAAYHQQLLHLLGQNRELLQKLASGIGGDDVSALPALLEQANATKSHADALEREERAVKKRFGITR